MKKLFIAMAAIISTLIFIASPLFITPINSYAASQVDTSDSISYDYDFPSIPSNISNRFYGVQALANYANINCDPVYYILWKTGNNNYACTIAYFFSEADIDFSNDILTLTNVKQGNVNGTFVSARGSDFYTHKTNNIVVNFNNRTVTSTSGSNEASMEFLTNSTYNWFYCETNCSDALANTGLSVSVDFNPDLENNVFRAPLPDNGVTDYSKYFTMDITNNSRTGIQYFFAIQDFPTQRTNINDYIPHPARAFCINTYNEQVYANEEWVYVHPFSANGIVKVLKPSHWHYIAAGESIHQDFSWSQYNLEKGKQYQVVVFAVKNEIGCASALNTYYNGDFGESETTPYVIDYSEAECVYYSSFTISNPVTYDPNDNKFGNYISSGDKSDVACYETKAYEDPSTGNVIIANRSTAGQDFEDVLGAPVSGGSHGGGGYYTGSSYSSGSVSGSSYNYSGGSFSSLNGYFSSFFAFITAVLNCFPSAYVVIITAGLSGLVVLGLIKVAIK